MVTESRRTTPARGRPPRIGQAQIVAMAKEIGLGSFSMEEVARRLGVTTPALYTHVEGRDHIVRLGAFGAIRTGVDSSSLNEIDDWAEWLQAWTTTLRSSIGSVGIAFLETLPWRSSIKGIDVADHGVTLLRDAGLSPSDAGLAIWMALRLVCTSMLGGDAGITTAIEAAARSDHDGSADAMREAATYNAPGGDQAAFDFDLAVMILGLRQRMADTGAADPGAADPDVTGTVTSL